jgi:hypothetical protein
MQHRPVFRDVDPVAGEHAVAPAVQVALPRQIEQQAERLFGNAVLGIIEQEIIEAQRKTLEPLGIAVEQLTQGHAAHVGGMGGKRLPNGG